MKNKAATDKYAPESGAICDDPSVLSACDRTPENWLRQEVEPAYEALKADPSRALTDTRVRAMLAAEHRTVKAKA